MKAGVLVVLLPALLWAQEFEFELQPEAFPVSIDGWAPFCPWAPGFSESTPDFTDIDSDGDLDLFVGEFSGKVAYIQNVGNAQLPQFQWVTAHLDSLHSWESRSNPDFFDIDADGDLDAIIGSGHVILIANGGTASQANFIAMPDTLFDTSGNPVFGTHVAVLDLDLDGDGDLICGEYQGHLQLYRNIGTPDSFSFYLEDANWLGISVGNSGSADPTFCDIDADEDFDLFIGERYGKIWYYRNDGTAQQYNFTYVTDNYAGIDVAGFSSPEFADIDGDGDLDLFVGREPDDYVNMRGDMFFYENIGTPFSAQFQLVTTNYLTADVGPYAYNPQVTDLNGDGAPDLLIGGASTITYFQNIGDSTMPSFNFLTEAFQGINLWVIKPCLGDIDADGDLDLLAGMAAIPGPPSIALYLNRGTPQNPQFLLYNTAFVSNPAFDANTNPGLADIDADGDLDLFINDDATGHFYFYQNNGTPQWPAFSLVTSQWQGIEDPGGWRGFCFGDLDENGDLDLLMAQHTTYQQDANLRFYRNDGTPQSASMTLITSYFLQDSVGWACPYLVDIDLDGDLDLFCGEYGGGVMFFRNITGEVSAPPPVQRHPQAGLQISLGPNPANPFVVASFELRAASQISLEIFDISGRKLVELASGFHLPGEYRHVWDAGDRAAGMYLIRLQAGEEKLVEKVVMVK